MSPLNINGRSSLTDVVLREQPHFIFPLEFNFCHQGVRVWMDFAGVGSGVS